MPLIIVRYATERRSSTLKADIAAAVTKLSSEILHKDPKVTALIIEAADPSDWFAGGATLADQKLASFWLDIHISDGTNTKDEKAAFIATLFSEMERLLGPLHNESYAHVHDVRADAYGFGGLTQERRYIASKLARDARAAA